MHDSYTEHTKKPLIQVVVSPIVVEKNTKGRMRSFVGLCTFTRVESSLSSASRNRLEDTLEELELNNLGNNTKDNRRQV